MNLSLFTLILSYAVLPNLYWRFFSSEVIRRATVKDKAIALTFDDGPDPNYTPELLDVLKDNNIKCTFFVLAQQALKYPNLIKRISEEGHHIGLHSLKHLNELFLSPRKTKKDFYEAVKILNELGIKIRFYRPPWGIFNPLTYYYAKVHNFKIMLWSIHASDWSKFVTADYIKERLTSKIKPGDIVLLHDGRGAQDAPKRTITALRDALPILKENGYQFILANELQEGNYESDYLSYSESN